MYKLKSKKFLSLVLSMVMVISIMPQMTINVEAAQLTDVAANGADGSELRPYIIDEADDLVWLGEQVEAETMVAGKHFMQIKDIDLSGYTWTPIGSATKNFNGHYNGNGYTISNLTVSSTLDNLGLFGYVSGGSIKNVTLSNASVTCIAPASGDPKSVGALAGSCYGEISNCHVTGSSSVVSNVAYTTSMGGLVGQSGIVNVNKCSSNATISSSHTHTTMGGIIGSSSGNIENCGFTGSINNTSGAAVNGTAGIAGYINNKSVKNCFSSGTISSSSPLKGAIVGNVYNSNSSYINSSDNNYYLLGTATYGYGSYYNGSTTSSSNVGTTALSDSQLKASASYASSWDFSTVWKIDSGYPYLRKIGTVTTTNADTSNMANILINAEVTGDGNDTISERGIEYLNVGDTSFTKVAASGGGTGTYSVSLAGIEKGIYYIRAYATNSVGTTYGDGVIVSYTPDGSGVDEKDPYIINSPEDLNFVRFDLDAYYILARDLDLAGTAFESWNPIGSLTAPFDGHFQGNGHVISGYTAKKYKDSDGFEYSGFFGNIGGNGIVTKLGVNGAYTATDTMGGIAANNCGTISECFNSGDILSTTEYAYVGGIAGANSGTIENCYNTGNISGNTTVEPYVGGISGYDSGSATITNCYNTGNIYVGTSGHGAGIAAKGINVTGCFNTGTLSGPVGETVNLAGISYGGTRTNCDFLAQTDLTIDGGTSSATGQADSNYFTVSTSGTAYDHFYTTAAWDFDSRWRFMNGGYPLLMAFPAPYSATLSSGGSLSESNLNGSTITVTLAGTTFNSTLTAGNFTLNNAPAGVTVSNVNRTGDTTCDVTLAYNGTDFDDDKNMSITIAGSEVISSSAITSDTVTIAAVVEAAPTATTSPATGVNAYGATLNGSVNANNTSTTVTFEYGTSISYGTSVTADQSPLTGTSLTSVSHTLTFSLMPNTTYHYRVVGVSSAGTAYGDDQTFTTAALPPTVTTSLPTGVSSTQATLNGSVSANNASTTVTFEYGTDTSYGTTVTAPQSPVAAPDVAKSVSYLLTGLTPNTTYHYRVVAENVGGITNGSDQTFTTSAVPSTVTTSTPTGVNATTATLNGSVNANNTSTTVRFEYGTDTLYGMIVTAVPSSITGTSPTAVSYTLTGLTPNTTYHYRVVGTSTGGTVNGDDQSFTTSAVPSTVTTSTATSVTDTQAILNGSVNANNASTNVTFEYGTDTSYGTIVTADQSPATGTSLTAVSYSLSGLTPETTYHYRIVGANTAGTVYGDDQTFTTTIAPPTKLGTLAGLAWDSTIKTKAIWDEESSAISYSIQLYKDGVASGSEVTGITTPYYDFVSAITEKGVYTFSVTAIGDGTAYSDSDSATVGSGLSAYAVAFKNNYNNSDTSVYTTNVLLADSKATAPTPPTRTGYTFEGWYTENSCATAWDFANNTVTNNTNLYAKWVIVPVITYTVTYNGNGATSGSVPVDSNAYTSGTTAKVKGNTGNLAKEGYIFVGWSNNGTTYTSGENLTVLGNIALTAVWNTAQLAYTATYNYNYTRGGVYTTQTGITSGAFLTAPSQPSRSGYTFSGWYKDASCAEQWLFNTHTVTGNVNLFAKWILNTYTVMGAVINDEETPTGISGATVKVIKGNIQVGDTVTTDVNGNFIITGVPTGRYNLVVEYDGKTVTKIINVENSNFVMTSPAIIPTQSKSSVVVISGTNTPPVVVGGLDNEVHSSTTTTTSSTFIITLTVEENSSSANANDVSQEAATSGKQIGLIFDIDLNKMEDGVEDTSYNETSNLLEIMIELPEELQGKESYAIYRYHEGAVDRITEDINEHGEYIEVNAEKTILTLHAKKFSTYAIAYVAPPTYSVQFVGGEGATGTAPTQADTAEGETITLPANTFSKTNYTFAGWSDGTNTYSAGASYIMQNSSVTFTAQWTYSGSNSSSGGGGGSSTVPSYTITTTAGQGGSISPENANMLEGESKTFAIKATTGYEIADVKVDGKSVGAVSSYTFSNISANHTIEAEFSVVKVEEEVIKEGLPYYVDDNGNNVFIGFASDASGEIKYIAPQGKTVLWKENPKSFTDISNHWAKAYIEFVTERELFLGTSSNTFSPNVGMTRGMFATVIGRLYERSYGEIVTTDSSKFTDVNYDLYYGDYVNWASSNNIISGVGNGKFEPNREITREEMAVILYRFANFLNISMVKTEVSQQSYPDSSTISTWAQAGAEYCQQTGIISGRDGGNFVPKGMATRAEVAAILERFIDKAVE